MARGATPCPVGKKKTLVAHTFRQSCYERFLWLNIGSDRVYLTNEPPEQNQYMVYLTFKMGFTGPCLSTNQTRSVFFVIF